MGACEVKPGLLQRICQQYQIPGYPDLKEALQAQEWDAAVICTLAGTHIPFALRCLERRMHVLIEKPLSLEMNDIPELKRVMEESGRFVAVGYVLHFLPGLGEIRRVLQDGDLGRPLQAAVTTGQHFPSFRPAYRETYYARHETGGGAIQDALTHNVNAVEWLLGPTTRVYCEAAHQALEGVEVEDTVCVSARNGSVLVSYAHNQFQAPNETTYLIHCEKGSLKLEVHSQRWGLWRAGDAQWDYHSAPIRERDDMFIAQANAFLDGMDGHATAICTVEQATQTLRFNLAATQSWRGGIPVNIES